MKIKQTGFTLIELIIVIAIIALLAAATFVAVNPAKRIGDANNAQRWADISAIADAWQTYTADNSGTTATTVTNGVTYSITSSTPPSGAAVNVCQGNTGNPTTTSAFVSLVALRTSGYIGQIPSDPTYVVGDGRNTGYYFYTDSTGAVKVGSCETYNTQNVEVVR